MTRLKLPEHVAIIMDGNGRWATGKGLSRNLGHEKGAEVAEEVIQWSADMGIKYLTLYSFSYENWKRPKEEVNYLFDLFVRYLESRMGKIVAKGVKMRFSGRIHELPDSLIKAIRNIETKSADNTKLQLIMALNYGGRQEIADAVNKALNNGKKNISEDDIAKNLYLADVPDPDLVIRTSAEERISNFLLWQSAYSELYFSKVLWPDFSYEEYIRALESYSKRQRRYGGTGS